MISVSFCPAGALCCPLSCCLSRCFTPHPGVLQIFSPNWKSYTHSIEHEAEQRGEHSIEYGDCIHPGHLRLFQVHESSNYKERWRQKSLGSWSKRWRRSFHWRSFRNGQPIHGSSRSWPFDRFSEYEQSPICSRNINKKSHFNGRTYKSRKFDVCCNIRGTIPRSFRGYYPESSESRWICT